MNMNRRSFIKVSAAASAIPAFNILPSHAVSPNEKVNIAVIGCMHQGGNIGKGALSNAMSNCVALCDVVPSRAEGFKKQVKGKADKAQIFTDFREMFDKMGNEIDACTIGVPDHAHFPIAMLAMSLGKHVYVEKPLAHTFEECALMMAAEQKYKVMCQMGNQGHSGMQRVQFQTWVEAGIIKNVRKVDACMNKGRRWHPWGKVTGFPPEEPMPEGMDWDVWAGTAPKRPYNKKYDPGNWRGWYDYGNGAFGDWGPHTLDSIHRFLKLGLPHEIRADKLEGQNDFVYPMATTIAFEFAERGPGMPAMSINWYDGVKNKPPRPKELEEGRKLDACGKIIYSDDYVFKGGTHSASLRIIPEQAMKDLSGKLPELKKPDTETNHMKNFIAAAAGKDPRCNSSFSVSGPLTQVFMLGCIAQRLGGTLKFDTEKKVITNNDRANELLKGHPPRKGWEEFYKL